MWPISVNWSTNCASNGAASAWRKITKVPTTENLKTRWRMLRKNFRVKLNEIVLDKKREDRYELWQICYFTKYWKKISRGDSAKITCIIITKGASAKGVTDTFQELVIFLGILVWKSPQEGEGGWRHRVYGSSLPATLLDKQHNPINPDNFRL